MTTSDFALCRAEAALGRAEAGAASAPASAQWPKPLGYPSRSSWISFNALAKQVRDGASRGLHHRLFRAGGRRCAAACRPPVTGLQSSRSRLACPTTTARWCTPSARSTASPASRMGGWVGGWVHGRRQGRVGSVSGVAAWQAWHLPPPCVPAPAPARPCITRVRCPHASVHAPLHICSKGESRCVRIYKRQQRRGADPAFKLPLGRESLQALDSYFQVPALDD